MTPARTNGATEGGQIAASDDVTGAPHSGLLHALQKAERAVRADLLRQYHADAVLMERARARLRAEESSVADVDAWLVTFAGRAATVYVLKSLYVRVLEDQGLLVPKRVRDAGTYPLFATLFPNRGLDAYLRTVFDDARRLLPELFAITSVEIVEPSASAARAVWDVWQARSASGPTFAFGGERLDTRFIGDLYEALDPQVKGRYALLQTPRFVESFILDRTLTPALEQFDLAGFRLLDPTCGSGHFLLGAFERLARQWREKLGGESDPEIRWQAALRALASVCGCDLNGYATALARFRLLLGVVRETGVRDPARLRALHFDVITCDALIPWESLGARCKPFDATRDSDPIGPYGPADERARNAAFFARDFHVVVGNPPYAQPADRDKRERYRELWPQSARGKYALSAPMTERFLRLPIERGRIGLLVAKSFVNREFGKGIIEKVLPGFQLEFIIDTSGASLPGHATPTLIIVASTVPVADPERKTILVSRVKGGPSDLARPEQGPVWRSIAANWARVGYQDAWIAVQSLPQAVLWKHPWVLGTGAVASIESKLERFPQLRDFGAEAGFAVIISEDAAFFRRYSRGLPLRRAVDGIDVRDWQIAESANTVLRPYTDDLKLLPERDAEADLWVVRTTLANRPLFGGKSYREGGAAWWKYHQVTAGRGGDGSARIVNGEIGMSAQFVYDASDAVCTRNAPVLVLSGGNAALYRDISAVLNSSTLEFWFKNRCSIKNGWGEAWQLQYVRNGMNVVQAPYAPQGAEMRRRIIGEIDAAIEIRAQNDPRRVLSDPCLEDVFDALTRANAADKRAFGRLVFLQEEIDWLTYTTFDVVGEVPLLDVDRHRILRPEHRPFEIRLAKRSASAEETMKWFARSESEPPVTTVPLEYDDAHRRVLQARLALIERDEVLATLEQPVYKRRWDRGSWNERVRSAATLLLADLMETELRQAGPTQPLSLADLATNVAGNPKCLAAAALLDAQRTRLADVLATVLDAHAIPDSPSRLLRASGLRKLAGDTMAAHPDDTLPFEAGSATNWKRVWRLQEREDRGDTIEPMPVAPPFKPHDYSHPNGWKVRGKFNLANERFIVYDDITPKRYGWGGWTTPERARASLEILQLRNAQSEGAPGRPADDPSRCPIQFALWDKLDELRRLADPIESSVRSIAEICEARCPCPVLDRWLAAPVRKKANARAAPGTKAVSRSNGG